MVRSGDLPSLPDLVDTISRLKKDYKLLSKIKGSKDIEDPESFRRVCGFLEMLIGRHKRDLEKERFETEGNVEVLMLMLSDLLVDPEAGTKDLVEKTKLGEWARNYAYTSSNN
jgi:hypothetical protein